MTRLENYVGNELRSFDVQLIYEPATSGTKRRTASALSFLSFLTFLSFRRRTAEESATTRPAGSDISSIHGKDQRGGGRKYGARVLVGAWWDSSS